MSLRFAVLSSGAANCFYVESDSTALLIDAGLRWRELDDSLARLNLPLSKIKALAITHAHGDHRVGLKSLVKNYRWPVIASAGTMESVAKDVPWLEARDRKVIPADDSLTVGDLDLVSFSVDHDANQPVGYYVSSGDRSVALATDLCLVDEEVGFWLSESNLWFLESNFDQRQLLACGYHPSLMRRIVANHMSNNNALAAVRRWGKPDQQIVLGHISANSNTYETVTDLYRDDVRVTVVPPRSASKIFVV